jgi:orotidine-5'-phosphate decarboxylase
MPSAHLRSYGSRSLKHANPAARKLLETMDRKKSNLAVSVDVMKSREFIAIIDAVGPFVCLIKA